MKPEQQESNEKKINVPQPKPEVGLGAGKRDANIDDRSAADSNPERLPGRDENLEEHNSDDAAAPQVVKH